jgi:hypothetical protein
MGPNGGGEPTGPIADAIKAAFGDFAKFKDTVKQNGLTSSAAAGAGWSGNPGSGKLEAVKRPNQDSPLMDGLVAVLGIDVWEHAYYLKYQNKRADYLDAWWNVVNWNCHAHPVARRPQVQRTADLSGTAPTTAWTEVEPADPRPVVARRCPAGSGTRFAFLTLGEPSSGRLIPWDEPARCHFI